MSLHSIRVDGVDYPVRAEHIANLYTDILDVKANNGSKLLTIALDDERHLVFVNKYTAVSLKTTPDVLRAMGIEPDVHVRLDDA